MSVCGKKKKKKKPDTDKKEEMEEEEDGVGLGVWGLWYKLSSDFLSPLSDDI